METLQIKLQNNLTYICYYNEINILIFLLLDVTVKLPLCAVKLRPCLFV